MSAPTNSPLPFHLLPEATAILRDRIVVTAPGYLAVHKEIAGRLPP